MLEPNPGMLARARRQRLQSGLDLTLLDLLGEKIRKPARDCLQPCNNVSRDALYNFPMSRILVIGATGRVGRQVVAQLPGNLEVRALARNPQSAHLPPHIEVVPGDLTAPESLPAALRGTDAVFLVWTAPPATIAPVIQQIATHARRIVLLSSPHQTPHPLFQQPNPLARMHAQIEKTIASAGLSWTFLRPGMFSANARDWWASAIRAGLPVRWPYLSAPTAPIDERDIAAIAVRALCAADNDAAPAGRDYVLTGPESLTQREQIEILGHATGRQIRAEELSPDQARRELTTLFPLPAIDMLLNAWAAALGQPALVTHTFAELTGAWPRTFKQWATDNAAYFL